MQVHVQYLCIALLHDLYVPLMDQQLKLCAQLGVVHYYENAHLLRHRSKHMCASVIYYQVDWITNALHSKIKYAKNLKLDLNPLDEGDLILLPNVPIPWTLI